MLSVVAAAFVPAGAFVVVVLHLADATLGRSALAHATTGLALLAAIAVGAGLGAWSSRRARAVDVTSSSLSSSLAVALVATALAVTWSALLWDRVPAWFVAPPRPSSWVRAEVFRFAVAFVLLGPAFAAFASLPAFAARGRAFDAARKASSWARVVFVAAVVGAVVAAVGAGVGALVTSSTILPALGARGVVTVASLFLLAIASVVAVVARREKGSDAVSLWASSVALSTVAVLLPAWNETALLQADATRFRPAFTNDKSRVVARAEDGDGLVTVVRKTPSSKKRAAGKKPVVTVLHDGVVVGDDARRAAAEARRAAVALVHTTARTRAFVGAVGSGRAIATLVAAGFVDVDVVAPSAALVENVRTQLKRAHRGVFGKAGVHVVVDDERAALARSTARYDVIVVDAPHLTSARAAALVSRGFFSIVQARLADDGVLTLSFPLGGTAAVDVAGVVATARSVFASVELFVVGDRAVVAAAQQRDDLAARSAALSSTKALAPFVGASFDAQRSRALTTADVDALARNPAVRVVDDGDGFAFRAAMAAWTAGGARATLDGVWALLPADVAPARHARLDELLPPRVRKAKAKVAMPPTTSPTTTPTTP